MIDAVCWIGIIDVFLVWVSEMVFTGCGCFNFLSFTLNQLVTTGVLTWYVLLFVLVPTISLLLLTRFEETQSQQCVNLSSSLKYAKQMLLQHALQSCVSSPFPGTQLRPCGLMDKAPDFGSGDCRFESCHGRIFFRGSVVHTLALPEALYITMRPNR